MDAEEELKIQELKHKEARLQENITSGSLKASTLQEDRVQEDISATGRRQFTQKSTTIWPLVLFTWQR